MSCIKKELNNHIFFMGDEVRRISYLYYVMQKEGVVWSYWMSSRMLIRDVYNILLWCDSSTAATRYIIIKLRYIYIAFRRKGAVCSSRYNNNIIYVLRHTSSSFAARDQWEKNYDRRGYRGDNAVYYYMISSPPRLWRCRSTITITSYQQRPSIHT